MQYPQVSVAVKRPGRVAVATRLRMNPDRFADIIGAEPVRMRLPRGLILMYDPHADGRGEPCTLALRRNGVPRLFICGTVIVARMDESGAWRGVRVEEIRSLFGQAVYSKRQPKDVSGSASARDAHDSGDRVG